MCNFYIIGLVLLRSQDIIVLDDDSIPAMNPRRSYQKTARIQLKKNESLATVKANNNTEHSKGHDLTKAIIPLSSAIEQSFHENERY